MSNEYLRALERRVRLAERKIEALQAQETTPVGETSLRSAYYRSDGSLHVPGVIGTSTASIARGNRASTNSINGGETISWTEYFDTDGIFDSGTPTRFTVQRAGYYLVIFKTHWGTASGVTCDIKITKNTSIFIRGYHLPDASQNTTFVLADTISANANDYFRGEVFTTGAVNNIGGSTWTTFSVVRLV